MTSRPSGYNINVAKMKPKEELTSWEREHGTGHRHIFNVSLGEISLEQAHGYFDDFVAKFPPFDGYHVSMMYVPTPNANFVRSSHYKDGDHYRIGDTMMVAGRYPS